MLWNKSSLFNNKFRMIKPNNTNQVIAPVDGFAFKGEN
jgi:hypothetical protein